MHIKKRIIAANWKSQLTFKQTTVLCENNAQSFIALASTPYAELALFPSYESLFGMNTLFADTNVAYGAQNCSAYQLGAYTGEVAAQSLAELGCTYTLVGHSERRLYAKEDDATIALKMERLLEVGVQPIVCVGETRAEHEAQATKAALERQLMPIFERLVMSQAKKPAICIAYEPVWAIGTGLVPQQEYIVDIIAWLSSTCAAAVPTASYRFLYGGSITVHNASSIAMLPGLDGLLIGSASLDFQNLQKIVSSLC